ncbi:hypothetical protein JXL21_01565, partial [Candidatus Bathyarchaeota archaeon]|nr:hypothetical protein [Candidatus Bathyarchaeota archaeon]
VVKLTIPETILLKAREFTRPPLLYVPVGLVAAVALGVGLKTGFIRSVVQRKGKVKVEELKSDEVEEPDVKDASSYQRRSSRKS